MSELRPTYPYFAIEIIPFISPNEYGINIASGDWEQSKESSEIDYKIDGSVNILMTYH